MWRALADIVLVVHLAFITFVAVGGFLAWRWRRVAWAHGAALAWALFGIFLGVDCPLTTLEKQLLAYARQDGYQGSFIDHYLEGVIYPESSTDELRLAIGVVVAVSYLFLVRQARRAQRAGAGGSY